MNKLFRKYITSSKQLENSLSHILKAGWVILNIERRRIPVATLWASSPDRAAARRRHSLGEQLLAQRVRRRSILEFGKEIAEIAQPV